jgi:hypothetical protein
VKDEEFAKLTKSISQAGRIRRGRQNPGRTFDFKPDDIKGPSDNASASLRSSLRS